MKARLFIMMINCIFILAGACVAQATLLNIGSATYNGSEYDLIWEDDNNGNSLVWFNYTKGGYGEDANYDPLMDWATGLDSYLDYHINPGYTLSWVDTTWRLPNVDKSQGDDLSYDGSTSHGYNVTTSEYGHLFYEELGLAGSYDADGNYLGENWSLSTSPITALSWRNISSQVDDSDPDSVWYFDLAEGMGYVGYQGRTGRTPFSEDSSGSNYAYTTIAVRTATVTPIPEPATMLLVGTSLLGLIGFRKRSKR